jgi:hypothetical protein
MTVVGVSGALAGLGAGALAAAIAVPVGVVLLIGGLVTAYCLRRRRKSREQPQQQRLLAPQPKVQARMAVPRDMETGRDDDAGPDALLIGELDQVGRVTSCDSFLVFMQGNMPWCLPRLTNGVRWAYWRVSCGGALQRPFWHA